VVLAEIACFGGRLWIALYDSRLDNTETNYRTSIGGNATAPASLVPLYGEILLVASCVRWIKLMIQFRRPYGSARTADQYFLSAKSIYGARISGNILLIQSSVTPSVITGDESTVVSNALLRILKDPDMDFLRSKR